MNIFRCFLAQRWFFALGFLGFALIFAKTNLTSAEDKVVRSGWGFEDPDLSGAHKESLKISDAGRQAYYFETNHFGRYSIYVKSKRGVAIQVVDRMAGLSPLQGAAGEEDGRFDGFLDKGRYKILLFGPEKGSPTEAELFFREFMDVNNGEIALLQEKDRQETQLKDFDKAVFWFHKSQNGYFFIEAAGRNVSDVRIWRNGEWLTDIEPVTEVLTPTSGQPLRDCILTGKLEKGFYTVEIYGGKPLDWAVSSENYPLFIRSGLTELSPGGQYIGNIDEFGRIFFKLPETVDSISIELPVSNNIVLQAGNFSQSIPRLNFQQIVHLTPDNAFPQAELFLNSSNGDGYLASLSGSQDQPFTLRWFQSVKALDPNLTGNFRFQTWSSSNPLDAIDSTGIISRYNVATKKDEILLAQAIELTNSDIWIRKFNLVGVSTVHLHVNNPGTYVISQRGAETRFRIEPFMLLKPANYKTPPLRGSDYGWQLDSGYYVLEMQPIQEVWGILEIAMYAKGSIDFSWDKVNKNPEFQYDPPLASVQFDELSILEKKIHKLFLNQQPNIRRGYALNKTPIDLSTPFSLWVQPGVIQSVKVNIPADGTLEFKCDEGSLSHITIDENPAEIGMQVAAGEHQLSIANQKAVPLTYMIGWRPAPAMTREDLEKKLESILSSQSQTTKLTVDEPVFFDLVPNQSKVVILDVQTPGLYAIESTGLLSTSATLRTRSNPGTGFKSIVGAGRNFLLQQYLREGLYQINIRTKGASQGHLGVQAVQSELINAGSLELETIARTTLMPKTAIFYSIRIDEPGKYKIESYGMIPANSPGSSYDSSSGWRNQEDDFSENESEYLEEEGYAEEGIGEEFEEAGEFGDEGFTDEMTGVFDRTEYVEDSQTRFSRCRLEDSDGWPVVQPGLLSGFETDLDVGEYRLALLPEAIETRRLTRITRIQNPVRKEGHGPFQIKMSDLNRSIWRESLENGERQPDLWELDVPADVIMEVNVSEDMSATMTRVEGQQDPVRVTDKKSWIGMLKRGVYQIRVLCNRKNDYFEYHLNAQPKSLVAGASVQLSAPDSIDVAVGMPGLYEIASIGDVDVCARLIREDGTNVVSVDDRLNDWNFQFLDQLLPGAYRLLVEPVGVQSAETTVCMRLLKQYDSPLLTAPLCAAIDPRDDIQSFPFEISTDQNMISISASSEEMIGVGLEMFDQNEVIDIGKEIGKSIEMQIPLRSDDGKRSKRFQLKIWSIESRHFPALLIIDALHAPVFSEAELKNGVNPVVATSAISPVNLFAFEAKNPGLFQLDISKGSAIKTSQSPDVALKLQETPTFSVNGGMVWICIRPDTAHSASGPIHGERIKLSSDQEKSFTLVVSAGEIDLIEISGKASVPTILKAGSFSGRPGLELLEGLHDGITPNDARSLSICAGYSMAVQLRSEESLASIWNLDGTDKPMSVDLTLISMSKPNEKKVASGENSGAIKKFESVRFPLPEGEKKVTLSLNRAVLAGFSSNGKMETLHQQASESSTEIVYTQAQDLWFFNLEESECPYSFHFSLLPENEKNILSYDHPVEFFANSSAVTTMRLLQTEIDSTVRGAGMTSSIILQSKTGDLLSGNEIKWNGDESIIRISHDPGYVCVWIDDPSGKPGGLWIPEASAESGEITPPFSTRLNSQTYSAKVNLLKPSALNIRCESPVMAFWDSARIETPIILPDGGIAGFYLPQGKSEIRLRSLDASLLTGFLEIWAEEVIPIKEGVNSERILAVGSVKVFSFSLEQRTRIGVGMKSYPDSVRAIMMDSSGKKIGDGTVQYHNLESGTYFIQVQALQNHTPVILQPVLLGITPLKTGPPSDIIKQYFMTEGGINK